MIAPHCATIPEEVLMQLFECADFCEDFCADLSQISAQVFAPDLKRVDFRIRAQIRVQICVQICVCFFGDVSQIFPDFRLKFIEILLEGGRQSRQAYVSPGSSKLGGDELSEARFGRGRRRSLREVGGGTISTHN